MVKTRPALLMFLALLAGWSTAAQSFGKEPEVITNSIEMKLVLIPAGHFMMGAEEHRSDTLQAYPYCDPKWLDGELPPHKVKFAKPFYMGQYEVTLGQFLAFYNEAKYKLEIERDGKPSWGYDKDGKTLIESNAFRPWAPGWKIDLDHPVVYVSWNDAVAFCEWLSKKEHKKYRLPTEAEWEYACRAGSKSRYSFGDNPEDLVRFANASDQDRKSHGAGEQATIAAFDAEGNPKRTPLPYPFLSRRDGYAWTAPVGRFQPNAFGLYDMHGNVWEWCSDWHDDLYYEKTPVDDPRGPDFGVARVARGGGFDDTPVHLRCAYRDDDEPSDRDCHNGFRVVCER
jgi:formylglycine-generating enzyme required for sulfatase activity